MLFLMDSKMISKNKQYQKKRDLEQQAKGIKGIQEDIETAFEFSMCSIDDIIHYKLLAIKKEIEELKNNETV